MPRKPRFTIIDQPQHVIIRGNNREPIFYSDDDYRFYLEKLSIACQKFECSLHAYVLMTNHVHLLITPHSINSLSKSIQSLGRYYVQYFNFIYSRTGTLWEGRYKASLIDTENYLLTCYRYIELNPVRAQGMVEHPADYPWSSYRKNAMGVEDSLVRAHEVYLRLGATADEQQKAYRELFNTEMPPETIDAIRESTNKEWVLGSQYFMDKISVQLERSAEPKPRGGDRRSSDYKAGINRH